MGFNKKEKDHDRSYSPPIVNRLTRPQLIELRKEIDQFREDFKTVSGEHCTSVNVNKWLEHRRAITARGGIVVTNYKRAIYDASGRCIQRSDCEPILFEQLIEDYEQLKRSEYRPTREITGQETAIDNFTRP